MGFICNWIIALAKKAMESAFQTRIKQNREKRADLKVFSSSIQEKAKELIGNKETEMVHSFLKQDHIYDLLRKTLIIEEKEEAVKQLKISFRNFTRKTFEHEFDADECIDYAVGEFLRLRGGVQQRNVFSLSNQLKSLGSSIMQTSNLPGEQLMLAFTNTKDKILCEEKFYDYNHAVEQVNTIWKNNHITQIIGPIGSGKKQIIAHLLMDVNLSIYIRASGINTIESFVTELGSRLYSDQILLPEAVRHYFAVNQGYTIVLTDMRSIDAELLNYLNRFPCKIIISSTELLVSDVQTYVNHLPTVEQGIKIYSGYRNFPYDSDEKIDGINIGKIIEEAGRIPECIRLLALYHSYIGNEIDLMDFAAAIRRDEGSIIRAGDNLLSPKEYIKTRILPQLNIKKESVPVLQVVSLFSDYHITKRLLQFTIDYVSEEHFSILDLVEKGLGCLKIVDDCEVFCGSSLINCTLENYDEDFRIDYCELYHEYCQTFAQSSDYKLREIYEACEMGKSLYSRMNEEYPDAVWSLLLIERAGLYELLGLHQTCIKECNRILLISGIKGYPHIEIRAKVTLSRALVEYGLHSDALNVVNSIQMNLTTDFDKEEICETKRRIEFAFHEYDKMIAETKANLSDNLYVRVKQFHQLATMNYYNGNIEDAEEYFRLACSLIEELYLEDSTLASMIFAAGSAICLAADKKDEAIVYGEKSVKVALEQNKGVNSHILTSYNNLGNAYLMSGQYVLAENAYMYINKNYDEILSPTSPMVNNSRISMEICRFMDEKEYDSRSFEILMIDLAKKKENYQMAVEVILSFGINAIEHGNIVTLKRVLDITSHWIGEFTDYPDIKDCYVMMNRLIFAQHIADMYSKNDASSEDLEDNPQFKSYLKLIWQGVFDNREEQLEYIQSKTTTIPVYSNEEIISDDTEESPAYWVFSTFPPEEAYMGLIIPDNSMLPGMQKGEILWIQRNKPKQGDIALYKTDNEKKWIVGRFETIAGKDMLIPENREYKAFILGESDKEELKGIQVEFGNG